MFIIDDDEYKIKAYIKSKRNFTLNLKNLFRNKKYHILCGFTYTNLNFVYETNDGIKFLDWKKISTRNFSFNNVKVARYIYTLPYVEL